MVRITGVITAVFALACAAPSHAQTVSDRTQAFGSSVRVTFDSTQQPAQTQTSQQPQAQDPQKPQEPQKPDDQKKAQEKPPQPVHTGFSALWHSSLDDFKDFPKRKSTWAFFAIGAAGALAAHPADGAVNERLSGSSTATKLFAPGKYLGGWTQVGTGVGMYVVGRWMMAPDPGTLHTNKVAHLGFDLVRAQILTQTLTYAMKKAGQRNRPTGECCSFPSGHASTTFATAAVLERHLGMRGAWPTIVIASYVAASRLHDNRHYLSDVVFGAALGTATGWTVVGRHGRKSYAMFPIPTPGGIAIMVTKASVN